MDETAINSADAALVTAKKTSNKQIQAPADPNKATHALGNTKPAVISSSVREIPKARPVKPIVVAKVKGMAYQDKPPSR